MSAITRANVQGIVGKLATLVQEARGQEPVFEATVIMRPEPDGSWVERIGEAEFRVFGRTALRAVALNDVSSPESLNYIDDRLSKLGVPKPCSRRCKGRRRGVDRGIQFRIHSGYVSL